MDAEQRASVVTGLTTRPREWTLFLRPLLIESGSPAPRATKELVPHYWQPHTVNKTLGRDAVPKFFWGGKATRALEQLALRLNLMGVWRDSDRSQ